MKSTLLAILTFTLAAFVPTYAQQVENDESAPEPLAEQLKDRVKSDVFSLGMLLQTRAVFSFDEDDFNGGRKFDLGATRLDFRGTLDNSYTYQLQLEFRNSMSIVDAELGYRYSEKFRVVGGASKPYISIDLDPGAGNTDFINRARQVGAMMNSREIGITAIGDSENFNYRIGIYNGTGLSRQNDGTFMYTARFGYDFDLNEGVLKTGVSGFLDQTELSAVGNTGLISEKNRILYGAFLEYDSDSVFGSAELLQTRFEPAQFDVDEETITGFFITLGTKLNPRNELLGRWDYLDYDITDSPSSLFTLGWNHQATSLISFAVNLLAEVNEDEGPRAGLAGQMQFQF